MADETVNVQAPQTTEQAPNTAPDTAQAQATEEARERRRIIARELADDDEIVLDVDGEERVVKARDWRRDTQRSVSADKRFREASERARVAEEKERAAYAQAEALRRDLTDPRRFREAAYQLGLNPRQLAEQLIQIEHEEANLTPEQRKLREYERMFEQQQAEHQRAEAERYESQVQSNMRQLHNRFEAVMTQAGIPEDAHRVRRAMMRDMAIFASETKQREGRSPTIAETISEIHALMEEAGTAHQRRLTPEQRAAMVSQDDIAAATRAKIAGKTQTIASAPKPATAAAEQPRKPNGQFTTANGERTVSDIFSLYGR